MSTTNQMIEREQAFIPLPPATTNISIPIEVWKRALHVQQAYDMLQSELLDALYNDTVSLVGEALPKLIKHALAKAQRELY